VQLIAPELGSTQPGMTVGLWGFHTHHGLRRQSPSAIGKPVRDVLAARLSDRTQVRRIGGSGCPFGVYADLISMIAARVKWRGLCL